MTSTLPTRTLPAVSVYLQIYISYRKNATIFVMNKAVGLQLFGTRR